jgi:ketosteroid isomerase-like protein
MKTVIAEHPILLALMIGITAAALIYGWLETGKKQVGIAGLVVAAMVPVSWFVSSQWVTDREQIRALIYQTAAAVGANDHDTAVGVIGDASTKSRARAELPKYVFDLVKVSGIQIRMAEGSVPPEADVDINALAVVSSAGGQFKNMRVPRRLFLKFQKNDDGDWVVVDYNHTPLTGQPDMYSSRR